MSSRRPVTRACHMCLSYVTDTCVLHVWFSYLTLLAQFAVYPHFTSHFTCRHARMKIQWRRRRWWWRQRRRRRRWWWRRNFIYNIHIYCLLVCTFVSLHVCLFVRAHVHRYVRLYVFLSVRVRICLVLFVCMCVPLSIFVYNYEYENTAILERA